MEHICDRRDCADEGENVEEGDAQEAREEGEEGPVGGIYEELVGNQVQDKSVGDRRVVPVFEGASMVWRREGATEAVDWQEEANETLIAGKQNLRPELRLSEETAFLTNLIDEWEFKGVFLIDVTLVHKCKEDLPAGENCIVQSRKPIKEEKLA